MILRESVQLTQRVQLPMHVRPPPWELMMQSDVQLKHVDARLAEQP
jgi:hypothetical protein